MFRFYTRRVTHSEVVFQGFSSEKVFWKYAANLPEDTHAEVWFSKLLYNFIEVTLMHGCSPLNLLHILRSPFSTSGGLLMLIDLVVFPQIHVPVEKLVTIEQTYHKTTLAKLQDKLPLVRKHFITLNFARSVAGTLIVLFSYGKDVFNPFKEIFSFYTPWKQKTSIFLFSACIERKHFPEIGQSASIFSKLLNYFCKNNFIEHVWQGLRYASVISCMGF